MNKIQTLTIVFCLLTILVNGQMLIKGQVIDSQTQKPLDYASIAVLNSTAGTMTNAKGEFELQLKETQLEIQVSYVGYVDTLVTIDEGNDTYNIQLDPYSFGLTEIIVTSLTPLEYIQKALEKHPSLIPNKPFETRSFFASRSSLQNDDSSTYDLNQAAYKTYFADYTNDTLKENSQLLLHKYVNEGDFTSILTKNKRVQKIAGTSTAQDSTSADSTSTGNVDITVDGLTGAGPSSALIEAKSITQLDFFNEDYFKKFKYTFGEQTFYQGRELIKINFSNKRKVEHSFYTGSLYLDYQDLAIVAIDYNQKAKIPFYINALLKTIAGFTVYELKKDVKIRNQFLDKWYPKEVTYDLDFSIKQKGEIEKISMAVVLNIEEINNTDPQPIDTDKIFEEEKEFEEQIFPIENLGWKDINIIKIQDN